MTDESVPASNHSTDRLIGDRPTREAERNQALIGHTDTTQDILFPTLEDEITLLDIVGDHGGPILQALVIDHLMMNDGTVFWIDTQGDATTTQFVRIAPSRQFLCRVQVARGFTAYQQYGVVCDLPAAIEASSASPTLIVAPALDALLRTDETLSAAQAQTLQGRMLARLRLYACRFDVPLLIGRTESGTFTEPIETVADRQIQCKRTPMGPQFVGDEFQTTLYPVGEGLYQTTFAYWRALLAARARMVGSPIDDPQPTTAPSAPDPLTVQHPGFNGGR